MHTLHRPGGARGGAAARGPAPFQITAPHSAGRRTSTQQQHVSCTTALVHPYVTCVLYSAHPVAVAPRVTICHNKMNEIQPTLAHAAAHAASAHRLSPRPPPGAPPPPSAALPALPPPRRQLTPAPSAAHGHHGAGAGDASSYFSSSNNDSPPRPPARRTRSRRRPPPASAELETQATQAAARLSTRPAALTAAEAEAMADGGGSASAAFQM
jgi:hypothetical protein